MFCRTRAEGAVLLQSRSPRAAFALSLCAECQDYWVAWTSHPVDRTAEPLDSTRTSAFGPLARGFGQKEMKNSHSVTEVCGERGLPGTGTPQPWPPTPASADGALQAPAPANRSCIDLQAAFCNGEHKGKGWEPPELRRSYRRGTRAWPHTGVQRDPRGRGGRSSMLSTDGSGGEFPTALRGLLCPRLMHLMAIRRSCFTCVSSEDEALRGAPTLSPAVSVCQCPSCAVWGSAI